MAACWGEVSGLSGKWIFGIIAVALLAFPSAAETSDLQQGFEQGLLMGLFMGRLQGQAMEGNATALAEYNRQVDRFNSELLRIMGGSGSVPPLAPMEVLSAPSTRRLPLVLGDPAYMSEGHVEGVETVDTLTPHSLSTDPWIRAQQLSRVVRTPLDWLPEDQRHLVTGTS
jgi:hypothetical protein